MPYRALARGLSTDAAIPAHVSRGLASDGIDVSKWRPAAVAQPELTRAASVVTLACDLPSGARTTPHTRWDDLPSISDNYEAGRTAIVSRVQQLVASLAETAQQ